MWLAEGGCNGGVCFFYFLFLLIVHLYLEVGLSKYLKPGGVNGI